MSGLPICEPQSATKKRAVYLPAVLANGICTRPANQLGGSLAGLPSLSR